MYGCLCGRCSVRMNARICVCACGLAAGSGGGAWNEGRWQRCAAWFCFTAAVRLTCSSQPAHPLCPQSCTA